MRPLPKRAADGALPGTRAPGWVYACVRGVVPARHIYKTGGVAVPKR